MFAYFWSILPIFGLFLSYFLDLGGFLFCRWPRLLQPINPKIVQKPRNNIILKFFREVGESFREVSACFREVSAYFG